MMPFPVMLSRMMMISPVMMISSMVMFLVLVTVILKQRFNILDYAFGLLDVEQTRSPIMAGLCQI
jgi:hypothetical protein